MAKPGTKESFALAYAFDKSLKHPRSTSLGATHKVLYYFVIVLRSPVDTKRAVNSVRMGAVKQSGPESLKCDNKVRTDTQDNKC